MQVQIPDIALIYDYMLDRKDNYRPIGQPKTGYLSWCQVLVCAARQNHAFLHRAASR
jgi:hypothetical protein